MPILIAALYEFHRIDDPHALAAELRARAEAVGLRGTLILAHEGINGTIAGEHALLRGFVADLQARGFGNLTLKWANAEAMPFGKLKIKVKLNQEQFHL